MRRLLIMCALSGCPKDEPPVDDTQIKSESIIQPCREYCVPAPAMPADIVVKPLSGHN